MFVFPLVVDPNVPATLYAGIYAGSVARGVFKSTDRGAHWAAVNQGLTALGVNTLAIDPAMPATLYVGADTTFTSLVFKSTDGAVNWNGLDMGPPWSQVISLAIDPAGTTVYAGTQTGLYDFEVAPNTTTTTTPTASTTTTAPCSTARCRLNAARTSGACREQAVPPSVATRFDRAVSMLDRAATRSGKQARRLLKKAKRVAESKAARAVRGKHRPISSECASALRAAAQDVVGGLGV